MADLSKLSDEDLMALKESRLSDVSDEGLMSLKQSSPEQDQGEYAPENTAPSVEEMDAARAGVEPTTAEALSGGWIESIPSLKDGVAAFDGIADAMEEGRSFQGAYSKYKENLDDMNTSLTNSEAQSPWITAAGNIAGTAIGLGATAAGLGATTAGAALTTLGKGVVAGAGVGAAQGLSRSRDRGVSDVLVGGAIGAGSELGAHYAMKAVKKGGKYLLDKAGDMEASSVKKLLGIDNVSSSKNFTKHLKKTSQKESEFLDDVLSQKLGGTDEAVISFSDKPELQLSKIEFRKNELGNSLSSAYKKIDEKYKVEIDINDLKTSLMEDVTASFHASDDPLTNKIGEEMDKYISSIGTKSKGFKKEVSEEGTKLIEEIGQIDTWTLSRTHKLQKDIRKRIQNIFKKSSMNDQEIAEQGRKVSASLGSHMDDILETVSSEADDIIGGVKTLRKQYGNMSTIEETIQNELYRTKDNPLGLLKEAIGLRSLFISGAATSVLGPAGLVVGPVVNKIMASPKTPLYLSSGLKKIATVVSAAPTGEMATRLNAAALMSDRKFDATLHGLIAEINLRSEPIKRNSENVQARQEDIRNLLKDRQPQSVADFDRAIKEGPAAIGVFMDTVSKVPGVSELFEPGVGFDGKVYSKEDKRALIDEVRRSNISRHDALQKAKEVELTGKIPDIRDVTPRPQQIYTPKNNRKVHKY